VGPERELAKSSPHVRRGFRSARRLVAFGLFVLAPSVGAFFSACGGPKATDTGSAGAESDAAGSAGTAGAGGTGEGGAEGAPVDPFAGAPNIDEPKFESTLDEDAVLGELEGLELSVLCQEVRAYQEGVYQNPELAEYMCRFVAISVALSLSDLGSGPVGTDASFESDCKQAYADCAMSGPAAISRIVDQPRLVRCNFAPPECETTVGELAECASDLRQLQAELLVELPPCDGLTLVEAAAARDAADPEQQPFPKSCSDVECDSN
jgi:hypothetical protein